MAPPSGRREGFLGANELKRAGEKTTTHRLLPDADPKEDRRLAHLPRRAARQTRSSFTPALSGGLGAITIFHAVAAFATLPVAEARQLAEAVVALPTGSPLRHAVGVGAALGLDIAITVAISVTVAVHVSVTVSVHVAVAVAVSVSVHVSVAISVAISVHISIAVTVGDDLVDAGEVDADHAVGAVVSIVAELTVVGQATSVGGAEPVIAAVLVDLADLGPLIRYVVGRPETQRALADDSTLRPLGAVSIDSAFGDTPEVGANLPLGTLIPELAVRVGMPSVPTPEPVAVITAILVTEVLVTSTRGDESTRRDDDRQ